MSIKQFGFILVFLFVAQLISAQIYYVSASSVDLQDSASVESNVITKLKQYDNVSRIDSLGEWFKVTFKKKTGFVPQSSLKKGEAVVTYRSVRTGARCKDGTRSSATGRGACSHHKGVSSWIVKKVPSVRIVSHN